MILRCLRTAAPPQPIQVHSIETSLLHQVEFTCYAKPSVHYPDGDRELGCNRLRGSSCHRTQTTSSGLGRIPPPNNLGRPSGLLALTIFSNNYISVYLSQAGRRVHQRTIFCRESPGGCTTTETFDFKVQLAYGSISSWITDIGIFSTPIKRYSLSQRRCADSVYR